MTTDSFNAKLAFKSIIQFANHFDKENFRKILTLRDIVISGNYLTHEQGEFVISCFNQIEQFVIDASTSTDINKVNNLISDTINTGNANYKEIEWLLNLRGFLTQNNFLTVKQLRVINSICSRHVDL